MMTVVCAPPDRSLEQRRSALCNANAVRTYRRDVKRDLKAGRRHVLPLLDSPPDPLLTMKVCDLLLAVPKVGRVKATRFLNRAGISLSKTVGGLSDRQRIELRRLLASQRPVGICSACGGQVVRLAVDGELASCECGAASIPEAFLDVSCAMSHSSA